jgi:hypothetical protein
MSNCNGHSWSKFWWRDWQNDPKLRSCSMGAQGYWMRLLCLAHEAEPVGYVTINGKIPTDKQLVGNTGATLKEVKAYNQELVDNGVCSVTEDGIMYSRRMVKDAAASAAGREWGRAGGNPNLKPNGTTSPRQEGLTPPLTPPVKGPGYPAGLTPPLTPPVYPQKLEPRVSEEQEKEERKILIKKTYFGEEMRARAEEREEIPRSSFDDELDRLRETPLPEAGDDEPETFARQPDEPLPEPFQVHVRRAAKAATMRIPYGETRSVEAQLEALKAQPQAVGADQTMGLRWQPAAPVRSIKEMRAAALAGCTPEQIAKAERYAQRAAA